MKTALPKRRNGVFQEVLYAQCWEDPQLDREAFRISPSDVVFTITSGGCNALTLLLDDPKRVISLDLNPHQNHLLELKIAALRVLPYPELLCFFGVTPSRHRIDTYRSLRPQLSEQALAYWDVRPGDIRLGIIHCGRYERYMRLLGRMTRMLVGRSLVERMFTIDDRHAREKLFDHSWSNRRWKAFTRIFLSRRVMSLFFDPAFFAQLEEHFSFGHHFADVVRRAVTTLPLRDSTYLSYALLGRYYDLDHLPACLRRENIKTLRQRLDRITIVSGDCREYFQSLPAGSISRFNFTNIFEWMPAQAFTDLLRETVRVAVDSAVLTYRNLLVPRSHPLELEPCIIGRDDEARRLHSQDLSFIYRSYRIEEVRKGT